MSIPLIIAINIGAAALLTLILSTLMLLPKRLHPHRHPDLLVDHDAEPTPLSRHERQEREHRGRAQRQIPGGRGRAVTDT
jgi:hypothetical protein